MTMPTLDPNKFVKPLMIRAYGSELELAWHDSEEYRQLSDTAQALSPNIGMWDKRTRAYRYMKSHEPRVKAKWLKAYRPKREEWTENTEHITIKFNRYAG